MRSKITGRQEAHVAEAVSLDDGQHIRTEAVDRFRWARPDSRIPSLPPVSVETGW